ncbi:Lrp/AsnC family transcriptional regulator [Methylobacterium isbiliense]|uniref:DNA-binding transcriptional activator DecR n=1 Tax=Methylobacterium isbiliense TaxID=315478 RepID=A0ABQ4SGL2_9HYPH|nr:Lrp/AsnC family transcriptional regulator [Methylobacterium isbiliense]MDN3627366.1 Lrp/AsnC family transcriptional regulator [Methylobacterium isbiliense]GJE02366.1 DNA-binding transcriptional activator DecR [Methylobacterium isbiliense]
MNVDDKDDKILALIQKNNSLTREQIGREVNMSPTGVVKRLKKLHKSGLIEGTVAVLDLKAIGPFVSALVWCSFDPDGPSTVDQFMECVLPRAEITNAWVVTGEVDVVLLVMSRTLDEYEAALRRLQADFPQLKNIRTHVVLRWSKRGLAIPFSAAS